MFNNILCIIIGTLALTVIAAECSSADYDREPAAYSGAQPGPACDYENTLPPTYNE